MTKSEFGLLVDAMKSVWSFMFPTETSISMWYAIVKDIDYKLAALNLQRYMQTETREPKPADLRRNVYAESKMLTSGEAWAMVRRALSNSTYDSEKEFDRLPEEVKRAVGSPYQLHSWATDTDFNESVISSNFIKAYNVTTERAKKDALISGPVMNALMKLAERSEDADRLQGCECPMSLLSVNE